MATKRTRKRTRSAPKTATLKVKQMSLKDLKPHPRNDEIRKHPEPGSARWDTLKASLEHDYFDPMVWNVRNGMLVSGHLRLKVMLESGFTSADVVVVDYDEPTHMARMLAANRGMGEDDTEGQKRFFEEINAAGFSLDLTGFDTLTLQEVGFALPGLGGEGDHPDGHNEEEVDDHEVDARLIEVCSMIEEPEHVVAMGETWQLGRHILVCGKLVHPDWATRLAEFTEEFEGVVFIACPDPYVALTDKEVCLFMVQPSPYAASHILSKYKAIHPDEPCQQL